MKIVYCIECGAENPDIRHCLNCGARLREFVLAELGISYRIAQIVAAINILATLVSPIFGIRDIRRGMDTTRC